MPTFPVSLTFSETGTRILFIRDAVAMQASSEMLLVSGGEKVGSSTTAALKMKFVCLLEHWEGLNTKAPHVLAKSGISSSKCEGTIIFKRYAVQLELSYRPSFYFV
mmetsp:Transcript_28027/g.39603  ORF Transcript_28027/g.39603 Transcript_28027/m.39603 type:complete len:106 (-) Transcript_28027:138-455(-)